MMRRMENIGFKLAGVDPFSEDSSTSDHTGPGTPVVTVRGPGRPPANRRPGELESYIFGDGIVVR